MLKEIKSVLSLGHLLHLKVGNYLILELFYNCGFLERHEKCGR